MSQTWLSRFALMLILAVNLPALARDVIVHVALVDQVLIDSRDVAARVDRLAETHPEARIESIVLRANMLDFLRKEVRIRLRTELRARLAALNLDEDLVSLLVINAHGTSGYVSSSIEPLGKLFANGQSAKFRETFEPLRGRLKSDARVVLLACSLLGGDRTAVIPRVEGLMNWLGATDGTLVGFKGSIAAENRFWRTPDPKGWDWLNIARASGAATVYGYFMDWSAGPVAAGAALVPAAYQLGVNAWAEWDIRTSKRALARTPDFNQGMSMTLRGGSVSAVEEISVPRDLDRILDCESRLTSLDQPTIQSDILSAVRP